MDDIVAPLPECDHKFKPARNGVLVCEKCGLARARRMSIEAIGNSDALDCSRGAQYLKKQRRTDNLLSSMVNLLRWW